MVVVDHLQVEGDVGVVNTAAALLIKTLVKIALMSCMFEFLFRLLQLLLKPLHLEISMYTKKKYANMSI